MSNSLRLELDLGNTRVKWRLLQADKVIARGAAAHSVGADVESLWRTIQVPADAVIAAVYVASVASQALTQSLLEYCRSVWRLEAKVARVSQQAAGVINGYSDYQRLGVDRWLAVLAASQKANGAQLIVDCGSAVTVDLLTADRRHLGGYIVPGLRLMRRALLQDTADVKVGELATIGDCGPGSDTQAAVAHGLPLMVAGLVSAAWQRLSAQESESVSIWVTGGDGELLLSLMPAGAVYCQDLVLDGLRFCEFASGEVKG